MADSPTKTKPTTIDWLRILVVPLTVAIGGWFASSISADRAAETAQMELEASYVELATQILSRPLPTEETPQRQKLAEASLREWAVDVLQFGSPVDLDETTAEALRSGEAVLPFANLDPATLNAIAESTSELPTNCRLMRVGPTSVPICTPVDE